MRAFSLVLVATSASTASAFALGAPVTWKPIAAATPTMGLFDGLAKAFENDSTLGERENAGLSKEKQKRTVTWVGPKGQQKKATVVPGQKLKDIARSCGIPIRYDCQEGTCKTCEAMVGNSRAKICVTKMPNKDVTIKYNIR